MFKGRLYQRVHELRKLPAQLLNKSNGSKTIIWVAGVQRSGTNMIMNIFDAHPLTFVCHEADKRTYKDYSLKPLPDLERYFKRKLAPVIVAKALLDSDRLIDLHAHFPGSKAIWPVRNFHDVINSHMVLWPEFREQIDEIAKGQTVTKWRGRNISPETRAVIEKLYTKDASIQDCKALFWYLRNDYIFQNNLAESDSMLLMRYEDLVQNPQAGAQILSDFSGLPFDDRMAFGIHARSIKKAPIPDLNKKIETACLEMQDRLTAASVRF